MKNKQETLVILSPGFPKNEADSTCMPPQQIFVKALKKICPGLKIIVITFQYPFDAKTYRWNGVKVIAIGGHNKGGISRAVTWIKAWQTLKELNKKYKLIGVLSFWLGECAFVGSCFANRRRLPHYSWLLGQDAKKGNKYFKWIKPRADSLIALSDFIVKEFKKNYGVAPLHVIPVGIDTSLFLPAPKKRDIDILGAGSLIPLKQYPVFVDAISYLKQFFPEIKATICGNGPEMKQLQTMAESRDLKDNLVFPGELPHKDVLSLMQRSKIFLHPSGYEGFGAVLSEALYSGAHVVSFCKPMAKNFRNHHVVKNDVEMKTEMLAILKNKNRGHEPVLICPVEQVAKNVISLFAV
jgi:glycosyltransferase involved in cell wall biosynthesis